MADPQPNDRDTCLWCGLPIFLSETGRWLHLVTGSAICPSVNVATPRNNNPG